MVAPSIGDLSLTLCAIEGCEVNDPGHQAVRTRRVREYSRSTVKSLVGLRTVFHFGGAFVLPTTSNP